MTLLEIPVVNQGILSRVGIKRLVMKIANAFKGLAMFNKEGSLILDVPGNLTPTKILERAEADFAQKCCLHEFTHIGDRITTFYICDWCKRRREGAWQWVTSNMSLPDEYDLLSQSVDALERAVNQIPMAKLIADYMEIETLAVKPKSEPAIPEKRLPFHLGGQVERIG